MNSRAGMPGSWRPSADPSTRVRREPPVRPVFPCGKAKGLKWGGRLPGTPMSGLFCEHKKLRTTCASCRPPPTPSAPKPSAPATPRSAGAAAAAGSATKTAVKKEEAPAAPRATGPGKPLLPQRNKKAKKVSAAEAENAVAWWVKK